MQEIAAARELRDPLDRPRLTHSLYFIVGSLGRKELANLTP